MERILVALDGSEHAERALKLACDLARLHGAELVLVHVVLDRPLSEEERRMAEIEFSGDFERAPELADLLQSRGDLRTLIPSVTARYNEASRRARQAMAEQLLRDAAAAARDSGVEKVETVAAEGDPADEILALAKANKADMIVMGSRGLSDLRGMLVGSVSHKVCHLAECNSVLVK